MTSSTKKEKKIAEPNAAFLSTWAKTLCLTVRELPLHNSSDTQAQICSTFFNGVTELGFLSYLYRPLHPVLTAQVKVNDNEIICPTRG